jgi:MFS transporter, SHS family, sialic acid transporter
VFLFSAPEFQPLNFTAFFLREFQMDIAQTQIKPVASRRLSRVHWMVMLAALLGWFFDGYEIGLFPLIARPALQNVLGVPAGSGEESIGHWIGTITACFLVGAALGGTIFGWLGDRIGRVRAMALSILVYSLFTGVGYFANTPWQLGMSRFVSALGMGGQWSLGVALMMECWPQRWRPWLAGFMGAAANAGMLLVGITAKVHAVTPDSWRWIMLVGALPALLVVFILCGVPESAPWLAASKSAGINPLLEIFSPALLKVTILALIFASIALIGTWGCVQWLPTWADQMAGAGNPTAKAHTQMMTALGAVAGAWIAPLLGSALGRRPAYFLLCVISLASSAVLFRGVHHFGWPFLIMSFVVGSVTASFYSWFPLYFPELFPTRVRATGQGFCFNFGRIMAAAGALAQGRLVGYFHGSYARAGAILSLVYLLGMGLIWLAPETKGKPLPA